MKRGAASLLVAHNGKRSEKDRVAKSGCRWTGRQTDGPGEGQASPRLGHGSLTVSAAQPQAVAEIRRSKGSTRSLLSLARPPRRLRLPPNPHTRTPQTRHTRHTRAHTTPPPPAHQGGPPCMSLVTLPGTRQVAGAEWACECQPTAKGPVPVGSQLAGALPQCGAQCTQEDNRPAHTPVFVLL